MPYYLLSDDKDMAALRVASWSYSVHKAINGPSGGLQPPHLDPTPVKQTFTARLLHYISTLWNKICLQANTGYLPRSITFVFEHQAINDPAPSDRILPYHVSNAENYAEDGSMIAQDDDQRFRFPTDGIPHFLQGYKYKRKSFSLMFFATPTTHAADGPFSRAELTWLLEAHDKLASHGCLSWVTIENNFNKRFKTKRTVKMLQRRLRLYKKALGFRIGVRGEVADAVEASRWQAFCTGEMSVWGWGPSGNIPAWIENGIAKEGAASKGDEPSDGDGA